MVTVEDSTSSTTEMIPHDLEFDWNEDVICNNTYLS